MREATSVFYRPRASINRSGTVAQRILVIGAGFAGMWSALSAARLLDEQGRTPLLHAVERGSLGCVMALLRIPEVDMEAKDMSGRSLEEVAR